MGYVNQTVRYMAKDQRLTQLNAALREGNIAAIKEFVKNHDIDDTLDEKKNTLLHFAVRSSNVISVEFILSLKPNVICVDNHGFTPLHMAADYSCCKRNQYEIADILLLNDAPVDAKTIYLQTPLQCAIDSSHKIDNIKLVRLLLSHNTNPNNKDCDGLTALHEVSYRFEPERINLLLDYGADITIKNSDEETPLQYFLNDPDLDYFRNQEDAVRTTSFLSLLEAAIDKDNYFSLLSKELLYIISGYVYNAPYNVRYNAGYKIIETNNNLLSGLINYSDSKDLDDIDYGNDALLFT